MEKATAFTVKVVELGFKDAYDIADLFEKVWLENAQEYPVEWRKLRALSPEEIVKEMEEGYQYFGVCIDGKLVGVYKTLLTVHGLFGEHQSVHPAYRRLGLATAMYQHFIEYAKKCGCKRVFVNILANHVPSEKIVEKMKFRKRGPPYEQTRGMLVQIYEKEV
ncbi:MAG: GNAT family N-acetyltransferase [Candidatus Bathyarchaeia archaeon]